MLKLVRAALANAVYPEGVEQRNRLEREANTDSLTELANRRAFDQARAAAEADPHVAFVVFDVNNFKQANDEAGHPAGDEILRDAAQAIRTAADRVGYGERTFRVGGDEFAALVPASCAERVRDNAEKLFGVWVVGGAEISLSGAYDKTYAAADEKLPERKRAAKKRRVL